MMRTMMLLVLMASPVALAREGEAALAGANPIRKVVTMLQMMVKKVEAEGEKEKELFEKFMCYCKNSGGTLEKTIADAEEKMPQLTSDIQEATALVAQLKEEVAQH